MPNETMTETTVDTVADVTTAVEGEVTEIAAETAETTETTATVGIRAEDIDASRFVTNAKYIGIGMVGIFLVMGILIIGTAILNKVTARRAKDNE